MLIDKAIRNGALKKITEKRWNNREPSRDGNVRDNNKRSRTRRAFATITKPGRKEYTGTVPKCPNCNYHHQPEKPDCYSWACFECGGTDHYKAACPRLNRAPRPRGNHPNLVMDIEGGKCHGNNDNHARGRAFVMGAEEARQDGWTGCPGTRPRSFSMRRFIDNFSKIAKPLIGLTRESKTFDWGKEHERAFQTLKDKLCNVHVLALLDGLEGFVVYCNAFGLGLCCVLMQRGNGYHQKDKIQAKTDKTEHKMESMEKPKVNPVKFKVKDGAK
nr:putative reverse transcriptase domain-containing protein [Tanacetum cinerariifolium]